MYPVNSNKQIAFEFDVDAAMVPISPDSPTGESLRYEGTYDRVKAARTEDDPVLEQGVWKVALKRADWPQVAAICEEALEKRTKDLQIASWLLEAWLHVHGFRGLREGLRLIAGFCSNYWEELYPRIEDGDTEYRTSPFVWMNEKLPVTIKMIPLSAPASDDVKPYCWADWEIASRRSQAADPNEDTQIPTQAGFHRSAMLTSTEFYTGLLKNIEGAMDSLSELDSILDHALDRDAPSLRQVWTTVEAIREFIVSILSQREKPLDLTRPDPDTAVSFNDALSAPTGGADSPFTAGPIRSRAEAYRRLAEAADYLARTEPHSPTPYLVRRAINWGSMQLDGLLAELVRDNSQLAEIFQLLQIAGNTEDRHGRY